MINLKKTALALALAAAAGQASAYTIVFADNWGFNYLGTGIGGVYTPIDEMTYQGLSFTDSTGTSVGDTFQDVGRLGATGFSNDGSGIAAGVTGLGVNYELTATFLDWTGTYNAANATGLDFIFNAGGTLNIYVDTVLPLNYSSFATATDGTAIMALSIIEGEGDIDFDNPAGADGNVDILFNIDSVAAGYWFMDTDGDGAADTDVATLIASGQYLTLGLTDSNNAIFSPSAAVAADFIATTGLGAVNSAGDIYTTNDGSFKPVAAIPEPGMLALLGIGLMGLGASMRRRKA